MDSLTRREKLALIDQLPVSRTAKELLRFLVRSCRDKEECWGNQERHIAPKLGVAPRTLRSALAEISPPPEYTSQRRQGAKPRLPLVTVEKAYYAGKRSNLYRIDWDQVRAAAMGIFDRNKEADLAHSNAATCTHKEAESASSTGKNSLLKRPNRPIEQAESASLSPRHYISEPLLNHQRTIPEARENGDRKHAGEKTPPPPSAAEPGDEISWNSTLDRSVLASREFLQSLYRGAIRAGVLRGTTVDRLQFFRTACYVVRCSHPQFQPVRGDTRILNPGATFRALVERGEWDRGQIRDEERARSMLAALEGRRIVREPRPIVRCRACDGEIHEWDREEGSGRCPACGARCLATALENSS